MEKVMAVLCFLITIAINSKSLMAVPQEVNANFTFQNKLELHASGNILEIIFLQFEDCEVWHDSGKGRENLLATLNGSVRLGKKSTCFSISNSEDRAVLTRRCPLTRILSGKIMIGDCSNQIFKAYYNYLKEFGIEGVLKINYSDESNLIIRINTSFEECDVCWNTSQGEKNLSLLILGGRLKIQRKLLPKDVDVAPMEGWIFVSIKKTFLDFVKFQIKCSSHHQQPQPFSADFVLSLKDSATAEPTTVSTNYKFSTEYPVSSESAIAPQAKVTNISFLDSTEDPISTENGDKGSGSSVHSDNDKTIVAPIAVFVIGLVMCIGCALWNLIKPNNMCSHRRNIHRTDQQVMMEEASQPLLNRDPVPGTYERHYNEDDEIQEQETRSKKVNKTILHMTDDSKLCTTDSLSASQQMLETNGPDPSETQESEMQVTEMGSKTPSVEQPTDSNDDKPIHSLISVPENDFKNSRMSLDELDTEHDIYVSASRKSHTRKNDENPVSEEFTNNSDMTEGGMGFIVRNAPQILKEKVESQTKVAENLEDSSKTKIAAKDSSELPAIGLNLDLRDKSEEINAQKNVLPLEKTNKASPLESILKFNENNSTLTINLPPTKGQECSNLEGLLEMANENKTEILVEGNTNKVREELPLSELKHGMTSGTERNGRNPSSKMSELMQTGEEQYDNLAREDGQMTNPEFIEGETSKITKGLQNEIGEEISKITEGEQFENNAETSKITKGEQIKNNGEIPKITQGEQNDNEGETSKITKGEQNENNGEIQKITQGEQNENNGEIQKITKGEQIENNGEIQKTTKGEQIENNGEIQKITKGEQIENNGKIPKITKGEQIENNGEIPKITKGEQIENNGEIPKITKGEQIENNGEIPKITKREQIENNGEIPKITKGEQIENNAETSEITKGEQIENNGEIPKITKGEQIENNAETSKITKGEQIENNGEIPKITKGEQIENNAETSEITKGEQIENNGEIPKITKGEQIENNAETSEITKGEQWRNSKNN